jgi:hypothetical protein
MVVQFFVPWGLRICLVAPRTKLDKIAVCRQIDEAKGLCDFLAENDLSEEAELEDDIASFSVEVFVNDIT